MINSNNYIDLYSIFKQKNNCMERHYTCLPQLRPVPNFGSMTISEADALAAHRAIHDGKNEVKLESLDSHSLHKGKGSSGMGVGVEPTNLHISSHITFLVCDLLTCPYGWRKKKLWTLFPGETLKEDMILWHGLESGDMSSAFISSAHVHFALCIEAIWTNKANIT